MLSRKLIEEAEKLGYREFTGIQRIALPYILSGYNVLLIAPTGSGKTEAAMFPIMSMMLESVRRGISTIYVTPLRALNRDILRRLKLLAVRLGLKVAVRHGDTPRSERRRISEKPPDILITTPETLQFILTNKSLRPKLKHVKWVVVDELHELLDDERGCELSVALERLDEISNYKIQRVGLSATIVDEEEAKKLLGGFRRVYVVRSDEVKKYTIRVEVPKVSREDEEKAEILGVKPEAIARVRRIIELTNGRRGVLVFTNTRDLAESLAYRLRLVGFDSYKVHHGSLSRIERLEAEEKFKEGILKLVIATSSLELGIDIGHVDLVVQYMSPRQAIKLHQKVGRSGHWIGKVSDGVIIASNSPIDILESAVLARRAITGDLEKLKVHDKPLDVLAHQIVGLVLEEGGVDVHKAYSIINRAYPFKDLEFEELEAILEYLSSIGFIRKGKDGFLRPGYGSIKYYYETSMIPDTRNYVVVDVASNKSIGSLDEEFVATYCETGFKFILAGRVWRVLSIEDEGRVKVEPSPEITGAIPAWIGELIPVEFKVAREVASIFRRLEEGDPLQYYPIDDEGKRIVREVVRKFKELNVPIPHDKRVLVEDLGRTMVVHVPLGSKGNSALALLLSYIISKHHGVPASTSSDAYRIVLTLSKPLQPNSITNILKGLKPEEITDIIREASRRTRAYRWKVIQVGRKFGVLPKDSNLKIPGRIIETLYDTPVGEEALRELLHEKYDVSAVKWLIEEVGRGMVEVVEVKASEPTPLAREILENTISWEVISPILPKNIIVGIVKKRILSKRVKLVCLMCGKWEKTYKLAELPEHLKCENCGSAFLAPTHPLDHSLKSIVRKYYSNKKLTLQEREKLEIARRSGDLVLRHGKPALIALSSYGIGPKTAAKLVSKYRMGEDEFYISIFEAEKEYVRTRPYWDR